MKFEEETKLSNFKAHYEVILGNISIANSELERSLVKIEDSQKQVKGLEMKSLSLAKEIVRLEDKRFMIVAESDSRLKEIEGKRVSLDKRKIEVDEQEKASLKNRDTQRILTDKEIAKGKESLVALCKEKNVLETSTAIISKQFKDLSTSVAELTKELKELRAARLLLETETKEKEDEFNKISKVRVQELASLSKQIEESRAKVLNSDKHFEQKEKEIARRENDVLTITNRLRKLFQEVKPGIALKI